MASAPKKPVAAVKKPEASPPPASAVDMPKSDPAVVQAFEDACSAAGIEIPLYHAVKHDQHTNFVLLTDEPSNMFTVWRYPSRFRAVYDTLEEAVERYEEMD